MLNNPIIVGRFGKAFGVRGWIKLQSFTDPAANILHYQPWYVKTRQGWQTIRYSNSDIKGQTIIIKLPDCNDPETAKLCTHQEIAVDRSQLPELSDEIEFYWADLIGMEAVTVTGTKLGVVEQLFETGANDVLVIKGNKEYLLPYSKEIIKNIDVNKKIIEVDWDPEF